MSDLDTIVVIRYRPIAGFPGYRIGDDGSVQSQRAGCNPNRKFLSGRWVTLKQSKRKGDYPSVKLQCEGRKKTVSVHTLVLEAFRGSCPDGMEAAHNNGIPDDNSLSNLRWDTPKNNFQDQLKHGTAAIGERHSRARLTESQVREIRQRLKAGETQSSLAFAFGIAKPTVGSIASRRIWKDVV